MCKLLDQASVCDALFESKNEFHLLVWVHCGCSFRLTVLTVVIVIYIFTRN